MLCVTKPQKYTAAFKYILYKTKYQYGAISVLTSMFDAYAIEFLLLGWYRNMQFGTETGDERAREVIWNISLENGTEFVDTLETFHVAHNGKGKVKFSL